MMQGATLVVCVLGVFTVQGQGQGQYWWLGTQVFRGDSQQKNSQQTTTTQLTVQHEGKSQQPTEQSQERHPLDNNQDLQQQPVQNNPVLQSLSEDNQGIPFQDLPQTECPHGMQCV